MVFEGGIGWKTRTSLQYDPSPFASYTSSSSATSDWYAAEFATAMKEFLIDFWDPKKLWAVTLAREDLRAGAPVRGDASPLNSSSTSSVGMIISVKER